MSVKRDCAHCMHKVRKIYKYIVQRRDAFAVDVHVAVIVVVEGDSCVKKEESASAELNRRGIVK
jgi:hypothetical protein